MGSSPRLRGTPNGGRAQGVVGGIIPALAGNTTRSGSNRRLPWDHPRACGEHNLPDGSMVWRAGSSPRLRGTPQWPVDAAAYAGIIPALAGNTNSGFWASTRTRDHPRACGEHPVVHETLRVTAGSSPRLRGTRSRSRRGWSGRGIIPRLRGTLRHGRLPSAKAGIIPALAGNTRNKKSKHASTRDHPRACGEHSPSCDWTSTGMGSSPRLRGTLGVLAARGPHLGIIPALAGNTCTCGLRVWVPRDHPRACGEHFLELLFEVVEAGSSPRLRGTLRFDAFDRMPTGIIPALAGNTYASRTATPSPWDHPRACGEHHKVFTLANGLLGSSPRLRGTLEHRLDTIPHRVDHPRACGEHG